MTKKTFTKEDYLSPDGMLTSIWGPPMWFSLHMISFNYPIKPTIKDKEYYYNYFKNIIFILPCKYCRDNLKKNYKKLEFNKKNLNKIFKNRDSLSRFIYKLHEAVNKMLYKKSNLTYEQVRDRYEHFRARCLNNRPISKIEKGCTDSLYGMKGKCVLNIVPRCGNSKSFNMDNKCKIIRKK
jgi:hypothetical protein